MKDGQTLIGGVFVYPFGRRVSRRGQTMVEYALILAIISVVAVGTMISMSTQVKGVYSKITSNVASAQSSH